MKIRKKSTGSSANIILWLLVILVTMELTMGFDFRNFLRDSSTLAGRQRMKSRDLRGIRPEKLSTAIRYGKRDDFAARSDENILNYPRINQESPIFWMMINARNQPGFIKKLQKNYVEKIKNDEISATNEFLKSIKLISIT